MRFQQTLQLEKHRAEQGRREEIDRLFGPRADIHQVYCINKAWHDPLTMSLMRIQSLVKDHLAQRAMAHSSTTRTTLLAIVPIAIMAAITAMAEMVESLLFLL
ncbi:hypothetical protein BSLG_009781 [Batrachochytrium salamandrivorans]|nr:hypothetical protein BSLG_009781 [Batrachochytrium salamandrivorans]